MPEATTDESTSVYQVGKVGGPLRKLSEATFQIVRLRGEDDRKAKNKTRDL